MTIQVEYAIQWDEKLGEHDDGYSRPHLDRDYVKQALANSAYEGVIVQRTVATTPWVESPSETVSSHTHVHDGHYPHCRGCGTYFCQKCDTYGDHSSSEPHPRPTV